MAKPGDAGADQDFTRTGLRQADVLDDERLVDFMQDGGLHRCFPFFVYFFTTREVRPLSHPTRVYPSWAYQIVEVGYIRLRWERVGVRGYGLSIDRNPSPGSHLAMRSDLSHKGRGEASCRQNRFNHKPSRSRASPYRRRCIPSLI